MVAAMVPRERQRLHQLHTVKLLVDWGTAIVAGILLWRREPLAAIAIGFGPSIAVTLVFLTGRFDGALEAIRSRPVAPAASRLSADVNALRFGGLALAWAGCWVRLPWMIAPGLLVIATGWWLAWRRAQRASTHGP